MERVFKAVWKSDNKLLTKNLVPGFRSYSEKIIKIKNAEYRVWDPYKSKPAAAILKGLKNFPIKPGSKILYLGIANGQTSSHLSDIILHDGIIYGVEISKRAIRDLNPVAEKRGNIVSVLADARKPEDYTWIEPVDVLYQDVATNDQSEIIIRNAKTFLKPKCFAIIAIKARSIDVTLNPREIYKRELKKLGTIFDVLEKIELDPYELDHLFVVMKLKG